MRTPKVSLPDSATSLLACPMPDAALCAQWPRYRLCSLVPPCHQCPKCLVSPMPNASYFLREWCTVPVPGARLVSLVPSGPKCPTYPKSPMPQFPRVPHDSETSFLACLVPGAPPCVYPLPRAACSKCFCFYCAIRQWRRGACCSNNNTSSARLSVA